MGKELIKISDKHRNCLFGRAIKMLYEENVGIGRSVTMICISIFYNSDEYGRIKRYGGYKEFSKDIHASISTTHKTISLLLRVGLLFRDDEYYYICENNTEDEEN